MKNPKFQILKTEKGQFYFHLRAANGEIILQSEKYEAKDGAENGIASVKKNSPMDERYQRLEAKNGQFYFNLRAGNHQVIGTSEMYKSTSGRDNGIESVKKNAPDAPVSDEA